MNRPPYPSTLKQSRLWFVRHGIAINDWCRDHNLSRHTVSDLLRGKSKGNRGQAHRAAILLGLKPDPKAQKQEAA